LQKAKDENKPVLVSIGYSACHWCHVMEKESFEDEETAAIMNEHFINIKIDREERPDLDHIYMDAVQAMTGSGGWPLNVFLTPDARPFYGGTYFPPRKAFNRPSWKEILVSVATAFNERRTEIDSQAENLTAHLLQSNSFGMQLPGSANESKELFTRKNCDHAFENILKTADKEWGGFGRAPKFPQSFTIQFLLRYYFITKNEDALEQACLSLDKMIAGGIYDQVGGGFARYSTDGEWLVPHFEKMLYDNALLISVLSEAFQLTKKTRYKEVIQETIEFVERELSHPAGGFYSALDADSEGEEGKFYIWDMEEVEDVLGGDAAIFCEYFNVTAKGNWEGKNILNTSKPVGEFSKSKNLTSGELEDIIARGRDKLLSARSKRPRPLLDDKIILSWNALMNTAVSKAFAATGNNEYRQLAVRNMDFLLKNFSVDKKFHHAWKNDQAKYPAFLDDHAFLIQALVHLQEITADTAWLVKARDITEMVIATFSDEDSPFFFYTSAKQTDVIIRKKEVYDGAVPSGNSIMCQNLLQLSVLFDRPEWRERSEKAIVSLGNAITKHPTSFAAWGCLLQEIVDGTQEIAVIGKGSLNLAEKILGEYIPHRVFMASEDIVEFPLIRDKNITEKPVIFLCQQYACRHPVSSAEELMKMIGRSE
jgi:uncharacterized protein YyaL (SSP411 family)